MNIGFTWIDYAIFIIYAFAIICIGLWVSRTKKGEQKTSADYFLAGRSLTWWAIGASLISANISAEHFIGMSGSGFRVGLGIAAYEWVGAITLIVVAKYLLPLMLEKKIYTMPQLLNERYGHGVSLAFSIFWLMLYLFVNLTSVAWLGALAMNQIIGVPVIWGITLLMLFAGIYSIYGGLKAVAWTDIIQVVFMIGGGLITAYFAICAIGGGNIFEGLSTIFNYVKDTPGDMHFNMVIPEGSVAMDAATGAKFDLFQDLPGLALIFGAIWVTNIGYWGFNQFIIQKGLAAKNVYEAKKGLIFAGYLKILVPLIVVIPGITAYVFFNNPELIDTVTGLNGTIVKADDAYPWLLRNFAPTGVKGLAFAALVAAVVSSLASMLNSISTIFTMDIYKQLINKKANEKQLVKVGRIVAMAALVISGFAAKPLLGGLDQAFQYIQEYSGYVYPGVLVVFGMALLWKRATNKAALWTALATIPTGIAIKLLFPEMGFLLRMGYVFIILVLIAVTASLLDHKHLVEDTNKSAAHKKSMLRGSYVMFALTVLCIALGAIFSKPCYYLAFEAIFTMAALLGFVGLILFTNAKSRYRDARAYDYQPELFKMGPGLTVGAIGVVVILVVLYVIFW